MPERSPVREKILLYKHIISGKRANKVLIEPLMSFMKRVAFNAFIRTKFDKTNKTGKSD